MKNHKMTKRACVSALLTALLILFLAPSVMAAPYQPLLQISAVTFNPVTVSPGKEFKMTLTLTNYGRHDAGNVTLDVISQSGLPDLGVFSMVGSGSQFYVEEIPAGKTANIEVTMVTSPTAEAKNYNLNLQINCSDKNWSGDYNFPGTVGISVNESVSMSIISQDSFILSDKSSGVLPITFDISNYGSNSVRGIQVSIDVPNVDFSNEYQYYGVFEKDDSDSFSTDATISDPGSYSGKIELKYLDSFNNEQTIEKSITLVLEETIVEEVEDTDEENVLLGKIVRMLFGIGV